MNCPLCPEYVKTCDHFDEEGNLREEYFEACNDDEAEERFQENW